MKKAQVLKKLTILLMLLTVINTFCSFSIVSASEITPPAPTAPSSNSSNENNEATASNSSNEVELNDASDKILKNVSRKDRRIAELTDKYNDAVYGTVAYYLEVAQKYSLPICFIGITIGAFNFLILGNKLLDKKEQGFGWIVGFTIGLVIFNVIPLIFALFVAGR